MQVSPSRALADFHNHGTLPFVGREREIERIVEFWRGTFQATELRAMLVTGEAGVGKSRLLDRVVRGVVEAKGSVVHVKFYPESTASFLPLVARALRHPYAARWLPHDDIEPKLGPVSGALQRLARLRPTLLVVEDLHVLSGAALPDLERLLGLLADESLALLALARPVDLEARAVLERFPLAELTLAGLEAAQCGRVLEEILGAQAGPEVAAALHEATAGNPLALRSALRGALKSADGSNTPIVQRWSADGAASLVRTLRLSVGLLAEGMTAHLDRSELEGARRLAMLGEVFTQEAAAAVADDAEALVEALLFKGVIATAVAPPDPLAGGPSAGAPLAFTHSLLHRHLIDDAPFDAERLVCVVADHPLYSILPFRMLAERAWVVPGLATDTITRAFDRTINVQIALTHGPQWPRANLTWVTAVRLLGARLGGWPRKEFERMLVRLLNHKLNLVRFEPVEVSVRWLGQLSEVTSAAETEELVKGRFVVLFHRELLHGDGEPGATRALWAEAEALAAAWPQVRATFVYADYVVAACVGACANDDTEMMRRIEERAVGLLASGELPDDVRRMFERKVRPPLLKLFRTEAQLAECRTQIAEFERTVPWNDMGVWKFCFDLLADTADVNALERIGRATMPLMREQGMMHVLADSVVRECRVSAGRSEALDAVKSAFEEAMAEIPEWRRPLAEGIIALPFVHAMLLRADAATACAIVARYNVRDEDLDPPTWILLALDASDSRGALRDALAAGRDAGDLAPLIRLVVEDANGTDLECFISLLTEPVLRITDIVRMHAVIGLISMARARNVVAPLSAEVSAALVDAVHRSMEWLADAERELFVYMRVLSERGVEYVAPEHVAHWRRRADTMAERSERGRRVEGAARLQLSMLGTITARLPDGTVQRFQGKRARAVLAIMVVDRMLMQPLAADDFRRLAVGAETVDIDNARDVVKTTVYRLREVIGHDMILTDGPTPRLNLELIEVDLLRASELLRGSVVALRRGMLAQAQAALKEALGLTRGEVPFPSLYDDLIEAVRDDFENELRSAVIDIVQALLREGVADDAAEVLHTAVAAVPGDEELVEMLGEALHRAGRRTEAERTRMQSASQ